MLGSNEPDMSGPKNASVLPQKDASCDVSASDLQRLDAVHHLLEALRDPLASSKLIEHRVNQIPVLSARMIRFARRGYPARTIATLANALALVGNRGLETVLLELLEDLTVLRADLEDQK
jgi:HD-like signal output (HDOD) protein